MGSPAKKAPSGPYADKLWREALRRQVLKRVEKQQNLDRLAAVVVTAAIAGDMVAAKEIGDRLDGRATVTVETTITERYVIRAPVNPEKADDWRSAFGPH